MTVAAFVKVYDGIVLATDSATTIKLGDGSSQVYNNADKIFHLHRDLPIAAMTWGRGQIGAASISTLSKDLRLRFMGLEPDYPDWKLDPAEYSVESIARLTARFLHERLKACNEATSQSPVGMLVTGYSAHARQGEGWLFFIQDAETEPELLQIATEDGSGWQTFAQPDATNRLFNGYDSNLAQALMTAVPEEHHEAVAEALASQGRQPVVASMPFPDAIALAKFLVEVTSGYSHFLLGPDTVGGPVEVAGLNRHEGFKWISRKHYYSPDLNQGAQR